MAGSSSYALLIAAAALLISALAGGLVLLIGLRQTARTAEEYRRSTAAGFDRLEGRLDQMVTDTFAILREAVGFALHRDPATSRCVEEPASAAPPEPRPGPIATPESRLSYLEKAIAELSRNQRDQANLIRALSRERGEPEPRHPHPPDPTPQPRCGNHTRAAVMTALERLRQRQPAPQVFALLDELERDGTTAVEVMRELESLQRDGLIALSHPPPIHTNTLITLK